VERLRRRSPADLLRQVAEALRVGNVTAEPQKRPHYVPTERMAILELRAAQGWSAQQTADVFHITAATIASWMRRVDDEGTNALIQIREPVNRFPDFVRYAVQRLKALCPSLGKAKIAEMLCRAGLPWTRARMSHWQYAGLSVRACQDDNLSRHDGRSGRTESGINANHVSACHPALGVHPSAPCSRTTTSHAVSAGRHPDAHGTDVGDVRIVAVSSLLKHFLTRVVL